jgi:hypothetical protein
MATEKSERATLDDVNESRSRQLIAIKLSVLLYIELGVEKVKDHGAYVPNATTTSSRGISVTWTEYHAVFPGRDTSNDMFRDWYRVPLRCRCSKGSGVVH